MKKFTKNEVRNKTIEEAERICIEMIKKQYAKKVRDSELKEILADKEALEYFLFELNVSVGREMRKLISDRKLAAEIRKKNKA